MFLHVKLELTSKNEFIHIVNDISPLIPILILLERKTNLVFTIQLNSHAEYYNVSDLIVTSGTKKMYKYVLISKKLRNQEGFMIIIHLNVKSIFYLQSHL